jgi:hypothetical protein
VPLPAARQTPNLEDQWLERSNSRHQVKLRERTPAAEGGTMGVKLPRILPKVATSTSLLHAVNLRHGTDGFTSPLRIFFFRKIRRLRPGLNPRTWVSKASKPHL